jgi:hypothetical protein
MLRPIFIDAGLITKDDDPNRLLFFTKLESVLQLIQHPKYKKTFGLNEIVKKSQQYLMCAFTATEDLLSINLDSFELNESLLSQTSTTSTLIPRVFKSICFTIDLKCITSNLTSFLKSTVFASNDPLVEDQSKLDEITEILINRFLSLEVYTYLYNKVVAYIIN